MLRKKVIIFSSLLLFASCASRNHIDQKLEESHSLIENHKQTIQKVKTIINDEIYSEYISTCSDTDNKLFIKITEANQKLDLLENDSRILDEKISSIENQYHTEVKSYQLEIGYLKLILVIIFIYTFIEIIINIVSGKCSICNWILSKIKRVK